MASRNASEPTTPPFSPLSTSLTPTRQSVLKYMKSHLSDPVASNVDSSSQCPGPSNADASVHALPGSGPSYPSAPQIPAGVSTPATMSEWLSFGFFEPDNIQPNDDDLGQGSTPLLPSSLHRAGLLQPRSYNPPSSSGPHSHSSPLSVQSGMAVSRQHSQNTIRLATMQLSNIPFQPAPIPQENAALGIPSRSTTASSEVSMTLTSNNAHSIGPPLDAAGIEAATPPPIPSASTSRTASSEHLSLGFQSLQPEPSPSRTKSPQLPRPSGLTLLRPEFPSSPATSSPGGATPKAVNEYNPLESELDTNTSAMRFKRCKDKDAQLEVSERTPLLLSVATLDETNSQSGPLRQDHMLPTSFTSSTLNIHRNEAMKVFDIGSKPLDWGGKAIRRTIHDLPTYSKLALAAIPAVLLGCLLNVLDGVSYGMIIFPSSGVFSDLGPMGVSLFFVSTVVSQLTYTFGGSGFPGANGSMMIEVVPFFHMIASSIAFEIGEEHPNEIIATTLVAFALSSILTGLAFLLLGALKLGVVIGFFPRHILVGCIGGIGVFLVRTGLTVSMRMNEEDFTVSLDTLKTMFLDGHILALWTIPLGLGILLRVITYKYHHQLIVPLYFIVIPAIFFIVVAAGGLELGALRADGWLFDLGSAQQAHWYQFYSYLDYRLIKLGPLWSTLPTQFALLFFNVLHPPLNVPTLAVSLNEDVDTNKELVGHGYSNLLSGLVGSVPNYLVYVNTLLFYKIGGDSRIAGFLLAIATTILLFLGTGPIAYIPVMVVGALIYVLGIDLIKEALWDTRHRVSKSEYITILSIMIAMTVWDFVIGVLFGIVISCFFFVVQNSRRRSIRGIYTGDAAMSAVRRPSSQRAYIREVAKQTTILRLQGFLFFGTIAYVEETIRGLIEGPSWQKSPVQFLVVDLTLVAGVDMSSAEAFVRIQRLLSAKGVTLVFCGFMADSVVGKALRSVDVLETEGVELFTTFNDAMEWTENAYLRSWFRSHKIETSLTPLPVPLRHNPDIDFRHHASSSVRSPRRSYMYSVGNRTIGAEIASQHKAEVVSEPVNTLVRAFSSYDNIDARRLGPVVRYFSKITLPAGHVLWRQGDRSDGLYIVGSGMLRATYEFASPAQRFEESMVPGTVAGELSALSDSPRNALCIVEQDAVLWKMSMGDLDRLRREEPELSAMFTQLVLKAAKTDYDILLSAIASRQ